MINVNDKGEWPSVKFYYQLFIITTNVKTSCDSGGKGRQAACAPAWNKIWSQFWWFEIWWGGEGSDHCMTSEEQHVCLEQGFISILVIQVLRIIASEEQLIFGWHRWSWCCWKCCCCWRWWGWLCEGPAVVDNFFCSNLLESAVRAEVNAVLIKNLLMTVVTAMIIWWWWWRWWCWWWWWRCWWWWWWTIRRRTCGFPWKDVSCQTAMWVLNQQNQLHSQIKWKGGIFRFLIAVGNVILIRRQRTTECEILTKFSISSFYSQVKNYKMFFWILFRTWPTCNFDLPVVPDWFKLDRTTWTPCTFMLEENAV